MLRKIFPGRQDFRFGPQLILIKKASNNIQPFIIYHKEIGLFFGYGLKTKYSHEKIMMFSARIKLTNEHEIVNVPSTTA